MITLVGVICMLSCSDGQFSPMVLRKQFETEAKCEDFKAKIMEKVDPVDWMDAKLKCIEGQPIT